MNLTFDIQALQASAEHTRTSKGHNSLYDDPATVGAGLWLVGDHGVYFMSNGTGKRPPVVYAKECNPDVSPRDWYDVKQSTFGGDDGAIFVPLASVQSWFDSGGKVVKVSFTTTSVEFSCY